MECLTLLSGKTFETARRSASSEAQCSKEARRSASSEAQCSKEQSHNCTTVAHISFPIFNDTYKTVTGFQNTIKSSRSC